MAEPVLTIHGVTKHFGAVKALTDVDFTLERGEVHALCGENGAGKSTLMNIIAGVLQPTAGEIRVDGQPVRIPSPAAAQALGNTPAVARGSYIDPRVFRQYAKGRLLDRGVSPETAIRRLLTAAG